MKHPRMLLTAVFAATTACGVEWKEEKTHHFPADSDTIVLTCQTDDGAEKTYRGDRIIADTDPKAPEGGATLYKGREEVHKISASEKCTMELRP